MGPLHGASKSLKKQSIWTSRLRNKGYVYLTYHSQAVLSIVGTNYSVGLKRAETYFWKMLHKQTGILQFPAPRHENAAYQLSLK